MLTKKLPLYSLLFLFLSGATGTFIYVNKHRAPAPVIPANVAGSAAVASKPDNCFNLVRQKGFDLISPLLTVNPTAESDDLAPLKAKVMNLIEDDKRVGLLNSASVYLSSFSLGEWIYINPEESYHPGSLIKVPMLVTYLKQAENDPEVLNKKLFFDNTEKVPQQIFNSKTIEPGHSYTVKELLHYMIAYSDNNATNLLNKNADVNLFKKVYTDLNMPEPDIHDSRYEITARRFSDFIVVLYNATYLSRKSSELALELLTECDFKEGMVKDLPTTVKVAHKFGEWGDYRMNIHEVHESGIVYMNNKPYLLTIMTKGNSAKELSAEICKISKLVYEHVASF